MTPLELVADALRDPVRTKILDLLARGGDDERCSPEHPEGAAALCACDLGPALGGMAHSKLAYHLKLLRETGLVTEEKRGKWVYYGLNARALDAFATAVQERWLTRAGGKPGVGRRRT